MQACFWLTCFSWFFLRWRMSFQTFLQPELQLLGYHNFCCNSCFKPLGSGLIYLPTQCSETFLNAWILSTFVLYIHCKYLQGLQGIHRDSLSNWKGFSANIKGFSCNRENPVQCTRNSCEFPVNPVNICSANSFENAGVRAELALGYCYLLYEYFQLLMVLAVCGRILPVCTAYTATFIIPIPEKIVKRLLCSDSYVF